MCIVSRNARKISFIMEITLKTVNLEEPILVNLKKIILFKKWSFEVLLLIFLEYFFIAHSQCTIEMVSFTLFSVLAAIIWTMCFTGAFRCSEFT